MKRPGDSFSAWLIENPYPSLAEMVGGHGGYNRITPEAWAEFDRRVAAWHPRRRRILDPAQLGLRRYEHSVWTVA